MKNERTENDNRYDEFHLNCYRVRVELSKFEATKN